MRGPLDRFNARFGIWSTKEEKHQLLAILFIIACWVAGVIAPWVFFEPEGFWQNLVLFVCDVVWAVFSGVLAFFVSVVTVKAMEK